MKMQHTIYFDEKHKEILERLNIGKGKQGGYNYNKAILTCIEAIEDKVDHINTVADLASHLATMTENFEIQVNARRTCGCLPCRKCWPNNPNRKCKGTCGGFKHETN